MASQPVKTPDLGNLNFQDIKDSLKSYLQGQDTLRDFNFEGSVMQTILNLLAYNTYYYAFYSNMVSNEVYLDSAQRVDSVVSLTKPLGYFVPLKTSARATLNLFGLIDDVPEYTHFSGVNSDGIFYSFFTLKSHQIFDSDALNVEVVEGKTLHKEVNVTNTFDFTNQRFAINDPDIDVSTLRVKVQLDGLNNPNNTKDEWVLADTLGNTTTANQNVFYVERSNNGVFVLFGKTNSLGNSIADGSDQVFVDYLSSSGADANDILAFSLISPTSIAANLNIGLVKKSAGGRDTPDLDYVKFVAPRAFGAQNRAVTKDDIKAIISPFFQSESEFNVFGGDETFPRMYGRVFFTADLDAANSADQQKIQQIYDLLRTKCVVTITPEFTTPKTLTTRSAVAFRLATTRSYTQQEQQKIRNGIKYILNTQFDSTGEFNFRFDADEAIVAIKNTYPDVVLEPSDFSFTYTETFVDSGSILVNLENELDIPLFTNFEITSEYQNSNNQTIKLAAFIQSSQNLFEFINLRTLVKQSDNVFTVGTETHGRINIMRGIIEIYDDRFPGSAVTITVPFKNSYFITSLNSKTVFRTSSVELK